MGFRDIMLITHAHVGPAPPNKLHFRELFYAQEIDLPSMREELRDVCLPMSDTVRCQPQAALECSPRRPVACCTCDAPRNSYLNAAPISAGDTSSISDFPDHRIPTVPVGF
jgi:hypothetical protein